MDVNVIAGNAEKSCVKSDVLVQKTQQDVVIQI
jgi:hypothetical protein